MILILLGFLISMGVAIFLLVKCFAWSFRSMFEGDRIDFPFFAFRYCLAGLCTLGIMICTVTFISLLVCMFNIVFGVGCGGCG